jgi:hypothetical protein
MISDAELLELEILFNQQFLKYDFGETFINNEIGEVLIKDKRLKDLVILNFKDRHEIRGEDFVISIDIFKILQLRYFRNNQSVFF